MYLLGMQNIGTIIALLAGVAIGATAVWLILRAQVSAAAEKGKNEGAAEAAAVREKLAVAETRVAEGEKDLAEHKQQLQELRGTNTALDRRSSELETRLDAERKSMAEKVQTLEEAEKRLTTEFENVANKIFEAKAKTFSEQNKEQLGTIVKPLREQLDGFRKKVEDVYVKETEQRATLVAEIKHLSKLNQDLNAGAQNLTKALKGDSQARGAWGEMILDSVLNASGLREGNEYEKQVSMEDDQGTRFRPDVVVRLPDGKDILIDSKVSLVDYDKAVAAATDEEHLGHLKNHVAAVRARVAELGDKHYDALKKANSLDYVLMFVPIESALISAIQADPTLYEWAMSRRVLVVGPSTLLGTMRTVQNMWRYEYQSRNAQAIADRAGKLYDKFVLFVSSLEDVGKNLEQARKAYEGSHNQLTSGAGNLVRQTEMLKELGAKARKQIDRSLLEEAGDGEPLELEEPGEA